MFKEAVSFRSTALAAALAGALLATAPAANAVPVAWTNWATVSLSGTGELGPGISVSPPSLDFGTVDVRGPVPVSFTGLGDLPGGSITSEAYDVSPDGSVMRWSFT